MRIGIAQCNPTVGDLTGNLQKIISAIEESKKNKLDLVVFSELVLSGYPPKDLLFKKDFISSCQRAVQEILNYSQGIGVLLGVPTPIEGSSYLYNSALLIEDGKIIGQVNKSLLPNYDVFEESRYFKPADEVKCIEFRGMTLGISICEDIWNEQDIFGNPRYSRDILEELYSQGNPDLFINISASPYNRGKFRMRMNMLKRIVEEYRIPFVYVNQVGGNDELVFDGASLVFDSRGSLILKGKSFEEDFIIFDTEKNYSPMEGVDEDISWIYNGLVLGMRDYFHKTGFTKALLGMSGGVDSSLVACIAADALGKENVLGVLMPSRYSSEHSVKDAESLAKNLGIEYRIIPIDSIFQEYINIFNEDGKARVDLAEENIQARIRGDILMFISNREGRMLVNAGNKSEAAAGYCTLYGSDMCGALSVIGDISKDLVYELCNYINRNEEIIPKNVLTKAPSAELRPDQKDEDSLPPYEILDAVMRMYVEENLSIDDIVSKGYDQKTVCQIIDMIDKAEYKRRQAPPPIKMSPIAFGMGRRFPIVNKYRG